MTPLSPPFHLEVQEQTNWCWTAVAASSKNWGIRDGSSPVTQCEVVSKVRKAAACANRARFNEPDRLHLALEALGISNGATARSRAKFDVIRSEIDRNRPVCARVLWDSDGNRVAEGAHFVVIGGYEQSGNDQIIQVFDPAADPLVPEPRISEWHYSVFKDQYRDCGVWVDTYFIKV